MKEYDSEKIMEENLEETKTSSRSYREVLISLSLFVWQNIQGMENVVFLIFCFPSMIFLSAIRFSAAADVLTSGQSIRDGEMTLVSSDRTFELGFFSPRNSKNRYLGIWYKDIPDTIVWVANRNSPLINSSGTLSFTSEGHLVLLNRSNSAIWSSNLSRTVRKPIVQLLDSGNLVLRDNSTENSYDVSLWQSFDYPSDTLLPKMKLGWNLLFRSETYLSSWKAIDDPSLGDYVYRLDIRGLPQGELVFTGPTSTITYRTGPWNGAEYSGASVLPNSVFRPRMVINETDSYYCYDSLNNNYITRATLSPSGLLQRLVAKRGSTNWTPMYWIPYDLCDNYGKCGPNSICMINEAPICKCLKGFEPRSADQWQMLNWSGGCQRKVKVNCSAGEEEGFISVDGVKLPDLLNFSLDENMNLEECRAKCLKNCSCTAYANSKVTGGGSGCMMWFGDLVDIREFQHFQYRQDIHIRVPASELGKRSRWGKGITVGVVSLVIFCLIIQTRIIWCIFWKRMTRRQGLRSQKDDIDLPLFNLTTISHATNDFSETNLIGAGGFGPVYKGSFPDRREIAVKRLLSSSGQGIEQFMNEVVLIARLQHRNLVGLLGCCIEREERMLVYEYMPNKSLDHFIFDRDRSHLLCWKRRFDITVGVARGLLYLHHDSKLQIIHRDLKTSNILLDANLNPKISDFGLARIFQGDEKEERTRRIVGTYGYMSPEYAFDGKFSAKSDVYGFGVLLLEIVSGKKNRGFCHPDHQHNLLGHAWLLWSQDRALELVDQSLHDTLIEYQVRRCIHVGLLCAQKFPEDRPTMSYVVSMLVTEGAICSQPKHPGFFIERSTLCSELSSTGGEVYTSNSVTVTMPEGR